MRALIQKNPGLDRSEKNIMGDESLAVQFGRTTTHIVVMTAQSRGDHETGFTQHRSLAAAAKKLRSLKGYGKILDFEGFECSAGEDQAAVSYFHALGGFEEVGGQLCRLEPAAEGEMMARAERLGYQPGRSRRGATGEPKFWFGAILALGGLQYRHGIPYRDGVEAEAETSEYRLKIRFGGFGVSLQELAGCGSEALAPALSAGVEKLQGLFCAPPQGGRPVVVDGEIVEAFEDEVGDAEVEGEIE